MTPALCQAGSSSQGDVLELVTTKLAIAAEKKHLKFGNQPHNLKLVAGQQEWSGMVLEVTPLSGSAGTGGALSFGLKKLEIERLLTEQEKRERNENLALEKTSEQAAVEAAVQQELERERAHDRQQSADKAALPPPPARMPVAPKPLAKAAPVRAMKLACGCHKLECGGCGPRCNNQVCSHFTRTPSILRMNAKNRYYWMCVGPPSHFIKWADEAISIGAPSQGASDCEVPPPGETAGAARAEAGAGGRKGEQARPDGARLQPAPPGASAAAQRPMPAKKREIDGALRAIIEHTRASSGPSKQYPLSASIEMASRDKCPRLQSAARACGTAAPATVGSSAFARTHSSEDPSGWWRKREAPPKEVAPVARTTGADVLPVARSRAGAVPVSRVQAFQAAIPQGRGAVEVVDICGGDSDTEVESDPDDLETQLTATLGGHGRSNPVLID